MSCTLFPLSIMILSALLVKAMAADQEFVKQPDSQNVSESTNNVIFNCTAHSSGFHWLINGDFPDDDANQMRGITKDSDTVNDTSNLKIHLLFVPALLSNDDLTIKCYIYTSQTLSSEPAVLRIQGTLKTVVDLQVVWINASSMHIVFAPPATLDGVPILHYLIEQVSQDNDYNLQNTTDTMITMDGFGSTNYTINISAWNTVGQGDIASFCLVGVYTSPKIPYNTTATIQFLSTKLDVLLHTTINSRNESFPDSITIILNTVEQHQLLISANCVLNPSLTCDNHNFVFTESNINAEYADLTVNVSEYVTEGYNYNATIILENTIGNISSDEISFDTFQPVINVSESTTQLSISATVAFTSNKASSSSVDNNNYQTNVNNTTAVTDDPSSWIPLLVVALCVFTGIMVILSLLIIFLMAIVMKYKKKNNKLKFAEMDARQKQRNAEVVLNTISSVNPIQRHQQYITPGYNGYDQPFLTTENPQYDTIGNIITNKDAVKMVNCPAYEPLPNKQSV